MTWKRKATAVGAISVALGLVATGPAGAGSPVTWGPPAVSGSLPPYEEVSLDWSAVTTQQWTSDAGVTPLQGDFNGDFRDDLFFYSAGSAPDHLWLSKPFDEATQGSNVAARADRFTVTPISVSGDYKPFTGDFDGNGDTDIFWYAPGSHPDSIWYFEDGAISASVATSVSGLYQPIVGDFDQNDGVPSENIFWYGPSAAESVWSGRADRTFQTRTFATQAPSNAKVLIGNFTPDNALSPSVVNETAYFPDLFFYVGGTAADAMWSGNGTGGWTVTSRTVNGYYTPFVGNFNQGTPSWLGGLSEIFWYAAGKAQDTIWMNSNGTFTGSNVTVNGSYKPFIVPGTIGPDAIIWNNPTGGDAVWIPTGSGSTWAYVNRPFPGADMGDRIPLVGYFDDVPDEFDVTAISSIVDPGLIGNVAVDPVPLFSTNEMIHRDVLWFAPGSGTGDDERYWRIDGADPTYVQYEVEQPIQLKLD